MRHPEAGDPMQDTGGLRKLRFVDAPSKGTSFGARRGKGKCGGLRVIYCWCLGG